jgi:nicotinamidase/pyrazinamidase
MATGGFAGLRKGDALVIVDLQNDFLPGGSLAVPGGDEVVPAINHLAAVFDREDLPIFATRDWHPPDHCSFRAAGGPWPPHCVAGTAGAAFPAALVLPPRATVISKATTADADAYSGFCGTELHPRLKAAGVTRIFVGGLATDYCVLNTVRDGHQLGYAVVLVSDAIRAVDVHPGDGARAIAEMRALGVEAMDHQAIGGPGT